MKMNLDCLRAVLLAIENKPNLYVTERGDACFKEIELRELYSAVIDFSKEDIAYSVYLLIDGGYIDASPRYGNNELKVCPITRMTLAGHELLEDLRDEKRWQRVKSIASAVRNYSLSAISSIAEGMTSAAIQQACALQSQ